LVRWLHIWLALCEVVSCLSISNLDENVQNGLTAKTANVCKTNEPCARESLVEHLTSLPPIQLPDTTPIYSFAAFELVAQAMEAQYNTSFADLLTERIFNPLKPEYTSLLSPNSSLFGDGLANTSLNGEPASLGLASNIEDLSAFGHVLLTDELMSASETRRWLKPVTDTSNLRNAVGRPWEIYHYGEEATDPIIDVYTKSGTVGRYSSYFGLVPDYKVGFTNLAVETGDSAPDLNAYADIVLDALRSLVGLGVALASENIAGT